uniref:Uncharacterized protein n=1 Tax=Oryza nivara TaxID=4536 RepID=A0A0E0G6N7_ORYNI
MRRHSRRSQLANALDAGADHCTSSSAAAAAPALRRPLASLLASSNKPPRYARVMAPLLQSREEKEMESR